MGVWETYHARTGGTDQRDMILRKEQEYIRRKLPRSLSYKTLLVNGKEQNMAVISSDNLDTKTICAMPNEDFPHGGLVYWMDNYWLITGKDVDTEVYARGTMRQCNHLLKWVDDSGEIMERWCIVEDGTKYLTGEYGDNDYIVTRGDARATMIIARDEKTARFTRKNRFIIDDSESPIPLAYRLTKPFKLGGSYNGKGIISYVLTECNTEDSDNLELRIANYYDHFPRENAGGDTPDTPGEDTGKKVWI